MKILIHAYPKRLWYVTEFLVPSLRRQGADDIEIWNDADGKGNLISCMESFQARKGDGGTWHIQDDALISRRFVETCEKNDDGVVYGFCNPQFTDDPNQIGRVPVESAWHSFQCVRIPDSYARECAEWFFNGNAKNHPYYYLWNHSGKMDDSVFRTFLLENHPYDYVTNLKPNIVEHVDRIIGGSILSPWRGFWARAFYWEDEDLVEQLKNDVKGKIQYV